MATQTRVTDFFAAQKRGVSATAAKKLTTNKLTATEFTADNDYAAPVVTNDKTPKRKKESSIKSSSKSTASSKLSAAKRQRTPKCEVGIDFKTTDSCKTPATAGRPLVTSDGGKGDLAEEAKDLNVNEVKEKLRKCTNLLDLKRQLSKINDCAEKVKQFKEIKVKTPTKSLSSGFRTPNRSPVRHSPSSRAFLAFSPIIPPLKSPVSVIPNYESNCSSTYRRRLFDVFEDPKPLLSSSSNSSQKARENNNKNNYKSATNESLRVFDRYSYLVDKPDDRPGLVLPQKYRLLADMFKSVDTIVSMHYKRQENCTFEKLRESVERMTSKRFDKKRLAQIVTIFADAFKLRYQLFNSGLDNRKPYYQLMISPVYNSNVDIRLNSVHLLERHQLFTGKLLDITKDYHKNYLNGLDINVDDKELFRWHPKFRVDSVPDIVPNVNAMPVEPKFEDKSAQLFLESTRQRLGLSTTTADADNTTTTTTTSDDNQIDGKTAITSNNKKITKGVLKGLSMDLLQKIRAKEAANLAKEMTRKPKVEAELSLLRSLPEFIRIIHSFFISSKKLAIPYDQLVTKIVNSFTSSLSILRAREHVDYLCQFMPDWIYSLEVKSGGNVNSSYIKIRKEVNIVTLDQRVDQKIQLLKQ
ncbi:DNA replication factor Cdt1-like [Oppia nitens]|uniref:DNA replication factor Cdt1-like n=1 Tax=Oppia nitens TaxID=1686743 RepID=UPI0023DA60B6|nr:DNA replication factor Cdt1-like [Oppia nitens]